MYMKYPYLDIDEEALVKGLAQIEKVCKTIYSKPYLNCDDCPLESYCETGLLSFIQVDSDVKENISRDLSNLNSKIRNDKMTF